jgi:hypothetical protein
MSEEKVREMAEEKVKNYVKLSDRAYLKSFGQKYVKIADNREKPSKVEIKKAWVARFVDDALYEGAWVELILDDNGNVLRVEQSR